MQSWIFLSPHLDDAVYSCGGWIRDRVDMGDSVEIWTIFAGDPPEGSLSDYAESLHARWGYGREAAALRREEDVRACGLVGAGYRQFARPDCIYRTHPDTGAYLYEGDSAIFGEPAAVELRKLVRELAAEWEAEIPEDARLICPLGLGGHVDHRIVRLAAERLGRTVVFYADVPYVFNHAERIGDILPAGAAPEVKPVTKFGLKAWMAGVKAYQSQFGSFWSSAEDMKGDFREYLREVDGLRFWRSPGGARKAAQV